MFENKKEDKKIVLYFTSDNYSDATAFEEEQMIHKNEFDIVSEYIDETIKKCKDQKTDECNLRINNTISVLGSRGSGKTSFLLSLQKDVNKNRTDALFLDIIDPTLIESKEHIFVNIVSRIHDVVMDSKKSEISNCFNDKYINWKKSLENLAGSLPVIDGVGKKGIYDEWEDPEFVLEQGLRSASAANNLERNFNKFVKESLLFLDKKCIIIPFDDVDTDFSKGWPVLECIRKYLTSPLILPLLSGDLSLYTFLISKEQKDNFDGKIAQNSEFQQEKDQSMIDHLVSQYLLKVLKPERRIYLQTLYDIEKRKSVNIKTNNENSDINIRIFYKDLIKRLGICNNGNIRELTDFLLSLTLRTQIRLISIYTRSFKIDKLDSFSQNFIDVFWNDLSVSYNRTDDFRRNDIIYTIPMLGLLIQNEKLLEAFQFLPFTDKANLNSALFAAGSSCNLHLKENPSLLFDYLVRIGELQNILIDINNYAVEDNKPSVIGLVKHAQLLSDIGLRKLSALMISYKKAAILFNEPQINFVNQYGGNLSLYSLNERRKQKINDKLIDTCFNDAGDLERMLGFLPLFGIKEGRDMVPTYSFTVLLASIGELVSIVCSDNKGSSELDSKFLFLSQFREFIVPFFSSKRSPFYNMSVDNNEDDDEITNNAEEFSVNNENRFVGEFVEIFKEWTEAYISKQSVFVSVHMLGRIFTRLNYSIIRAESQFKKKDKLGDRFSRYVILFFNSVLIEDALEHDIKLSDLNNPTKDNRIFHNNMLSYKKLDYDTKEILGFSKWMLSCPILLSFLNPVDLIKIQELMSIEFGFDYKSMKIYTCLNKVDIRPMEYASKERDVVEETIKYQQDNTKKILSAFQKSNGEMLTRITNCLSETIEKSQKGTSESIDKLVTVLEKYASQKDKNNLVEDVTKTNVESLKNRLETNEDEKND